MKSGNLNYLEPPGPFQASNGTALPFIHVYRILHSDSFCAYDPLKKNLQETAPATYNFCMGAITDYKICPHTAHGRSQIHK